MKVFSIVLFSLVAAHTTGDSVEHTPAEPLVRGDEREPSNEVLNRLFHTLQSKQNSETQPDKDENSTSIVSRASAKIERENSNSTAVQVELSNNQTAQTAPPVVVSRSDKRVRFSDSTTDKAAIKKTAAHKKKADKKASAASEDAKTTAAPSSDSEELSGDLSFFDKLKKWGKKGGYIASAVGSETSDDVIVVRDVSTETVYCLAVRGKYKVSKIVPACLDDTQEFHRRACYKKCSILTNGEFPLRKGITACAREGCDWETEELWGDKCVKKCSLLTDGMYPRRTMHNTCAKSLEQYDCKWYNFWQCHKLSGLYGCNGYYVGGDGSCPKDYTEYNVRAWYKNDNTPMKRRCLSDELLLNGFCHKKVDCSLTPQ